jgi:ribosomal protein S18 acetylase RimI-like enzyme
MSTHHETKRIYLDADKPSLDSMIEHFGVKGMHWGVRKETSSKPKLVGLGPDRIERTTASGDKLVISKNPPNAMIKGLSRLSTRYTNMYNKGAFLTLHDKDGKKLGEAIIAKKSEDDLYVNWIDVKKGSRGKGYATEAMRAVQDQAKAGGYKKVTLEVPGNSPDARHIYEKLGFKVLEEDIDPTDLVWGGLTTMEYRVK